MAGFGSMAGDGVADWGRDEGDPDWFGQPDPRWGPGQVNQSPNVEDRRGEGALAGWAGALKADFLKRGLSLDDYRRMVQHPMTSLRDLQPQEPMPAVNPLGVEAGMLDIVPGHQMWVARRKLGEMLALQADPNTRAFTEGLNETPVLAEHNNRMKR